MHQAVPQSRAVGPDQAPSGPRSPIPTQAVPGAAPAPPPGAGGMGTLPAGYMLAAMPIPALAGGQDAVVRPGSLTLAQVTRRVRRRWPALAVSVLVGLATAAGLTYTAAPVYTAWASVLVQPVIAEQFGNVNIGSVLNMATEAQVARSLSVATAAADQLGTPAEQVRAALDVESPQDTQVLNIYYRAETGQAAAEGAQTVATSYLAYREANAAADADRRLASVNDQIDAITKRIAAGGETSGFQDSLRSLLADKRELTSIKATTGGRVITSAVPPSARSAPRPVVNLAAGGVVGVLLGLALAVFRPLRRENLPVPELPATAHPGGRGPRHPDPAAGPPPGPAPTARARRARATADVAPVTDWVEDGADRGDGERQWWDQRGSRRTG